MKTEADTLRSDYERSMYDDDKNGQAEADRQSVRDTGISCFAAVGIVCVSIAVGLLCSPGWGFLVAGIIFIGAAYLSVSTERRKK